MISTGRYNLGLLLGDFVDVEGDSEEGNDFLSEVLENFPHPKWQSSKSVHHLFLNPDKKIQTHRFEDIEFRAAGTQSVLPPSLHEDGSVYAWLSGTQFPVPPLPDPLLDFYRSRCPESKKKPDIIKTQCRVCGRKENLHKKRLVLEVRAFREQNLPWMCHKCREIDIRPACRRLRKTQQIPHSWQKSFGR